MEKNYVSLPTGKTNLKLFKIALLLMLCGPAKIIFGQTTLYSTDFGVVANVNPANWSFAGLGMNISTNNASSGYSGASGGACLGEGNSTTFTNTSGSQQLTSPLGNSEAVLLVNSTGFSTVTVSFGMRKSSAGYNTNATYSFEWSSDGITYNPITYTEATAGSWGLASGAGLILPAGAGNQPTLYLRWSFARTGAASNFKIDDVSVIGSNTPPPSTISFLSNDTTVSESTTSANIFFKLTATSTASSAISVSVSALSNASTGDYVIAVNTVTFAANAPVNSTASLAITLNNDALAESAEYIVIRLFNPQNTNIGAINQFFFYIGDDDKVIPSASNSLSLNLIGSFSNGVSGSNSAEIVAHDPLSQRLFIANSIGAKLDVVNFMNPAAPSLLVSVPVTTYGNINSVAVKNGIVAAAIENGVNPQDSGKVVFFNTDGVFLKQVKVGMMPDMITFNHAGTKVITANEGEPNAAYTNDPDGSVSIIDISGGIANVTQANVSHVTFTAYNGQEATLRAQGIRIYGPGANSAKDFEPEYVTVSPDDSKAWVSLQENNAMVQIDLTNNSITNIRALGTKNHALLNNGFDASNVTRGVNISNFPVKGFYLPDAIASYTVGGTTYIISANEGDARAYSGFSEEKRVNQVLLDPVKFPDGLELKNNYALGRLNITDRHGDTDNDGDLDTIYAYGSRSFSIWNATTGNLVYDSKDDLETITATGSFSLLFNASNSNGTKKDRSDDKGPEAEGVTIGTVGGNIYAFVALERIGGVMVYDVTNPNSPVYVTYVNNRSLPSNGPDLGSEGLIFIPQSQSPNGQHIVIAANEVSSTLTFWGIPGCSSPLLSSLSIAGNFTSACANSGPVLSVPSTTGVTYQWSNNGAPISGATTNTITAVTSGIYSVAIVGGTNCATSSIAKSVTVNPLPVISVSGPTAVCLGGSVTQTLSGAASYSYNAIASGSIFTIAPGATANYTFTGTSLLGCKNSAVKQIVVNSYPIVSVFAVPGAICLGQSATLTAVGASSYSWNTGSTNSEISVAPGATTVYSVAGTSNGCSSMVVSTVSVNPVPAPGITSSGLLICAGENATLTANGGLSYSWNNGSANSTIIVSPSATTDYTVIATNSFNCSSPAQITLSVSACTALSDAFDAGNVYVIYPNPATEALKISFANHKVVNVKLTNPMGAVMLDIRNYTSDSAIDLSGLSKGVYFVQIVSGQYHTSKKIVLE
ncbi:MAG: choice-of-anchor I family protein [Bacteroidota bacterium]